jgi:hypothetical protein
MFSIVRPPGMTDGLAMDRGVICLTTSRVASMGAHDSFRAYTLSINVMEVGLVASFGELLRTCGQSNR